MRRDPDPPWFTQVVFRKDALEEFDEGFRYGRRPKVPPPEPVHGMHNQESASRLRLLLSLGDVCLLVELQQRVGLGMVWAHSPQRLGDRVF